ncbi:MAG TPA: VOC family protein [Acidimicrobiia bacterium]|jgi:catechol 2,3-dioxygenase-like lactoylglutathione lyase family enzyme
MLDDATYVGFIPVRDAAVAKSFYEGVLELEVLDDSPFALVVDAHGTVVRVTPVGEFTAQPFTVAGWNVADIDAEVRALTDRGVNFTRYDGMEQDEVGVWTAPGGDRVAWFTDPDGNTLSLTAFASS